MPGVCVRAHELAHLASDSFMMLGGGGEPRGHISALASTPGERLLTLPLNTNPARPPRQKKARVNRENEPYLPQKLPFAVGPARHGVGHHLGQLRFGVFGFILVSFGRGRRLESSALRNIRIHGVARNTLRRGEVRIHGRDEQRLPPGFLPLRLFSAAPLVRTDTSTAPDRIHPACPCAALAAFIGASDVTEPEAGRGRTFGPGREFTEK